MASTHPLVCISKEKNVNYKGIFSSGESPLDYIFPLFMLQLILCVVISKAIYVILRPLKQPKIVCSILAGIILGPSVLGRSKSYMATIFPAKEATVLATFSHLATNMFLFLMCIKMDAAMVYKTAKKTWKIGLASVVVPFIFTIALVTSLNHFLPGLKAGALFSIQFSVVSSLSYFIVIVHALDELNLLSTELGQLSTTIAMLNEIVEWMLVIVSPVWAQKKTSHMLYSIVALAGFVAFTIFVIRPILYWINKRTPKGEPPKECYVIAIIVWSLIMGVITDAIGFGFTLGSMAMGFIMPKRLGAAIIQKSELLTFEFFLPLFFIRIGYFTNLSIIQDWSEFAVFGAVALVGFLGKLVGTLTVSSFSDVKTSTAVLLSLVLSLTGMVELLHGIGWKHAKVLSEQNFATLVLSIIVLNAIITPLIPILYEAQVKSCNSSKLRSWSLGMNSLLGELRIISCVQREDNVPSFISLFEALNPREMSPICAYIVHLIPLATQSIPLLVPYKNHMRMVRKTNDSDNIMQAFLNYAKNSQGPVQIQPFRMISPTKYMHESVCRLVEEMHTPLVIVPFFKSQEAHSSGSPLRAFSTSIQASARCTVGILVDRGLRKDINSSGFSFNVAMIFLGGPDDREALAFVTRMSRHANISVTLLKINVIGESARGSQSERLLDDCFFRDFKSMNIANPCVVCHELLAENNEDVMNTVNSLGNSYDLVVVGKRQGCNSQFENSLIGWAEYPELGVIGDAIAARDSCEGMMSILVLQGHSELENSPNASSRRG